MLCVKSHQPRRQRRSRRRCYLAASFCRHSRLSSSSSSSSSSSTSTTSSYVWRSNYLGHFLSKQQKTEIITRPKKRLTFNFGRSFRKKNKLNGTAKTFFKLKINFLRENLFLSSSLFGNKKCRIRRFV